MIPYHSEIVGELECINDFTNQITNLENPIFDIITTSPLTSKILRNMGKRIWDHYNIVGPELYIVDDTFYMPEGSGHTTFSNFNYNGEKVRGCIIVAGHAKRQRGTVAHELTHWAVGCLYGTSHGHCEHFIKRELEITRILWPNQPYSNWLRAAFQQLLDVRNR